MIIKQKKSSSFLALGHMLIKATGGGSDTKVLPRAVQQLKMLPRADTKSHFWHPIADTNPILIVLERTNENIVT